MYTNVSEAIVTTQASPEDTATTQGSATTQEISTDPTNNGVLDNTASDSALDNDVLDNIPENRLPGSDSGFDNEILDNNSFETEASDNISLNQPTSREPIQTPASLATNDQPQNDQGFENDSYNDNGAWNRVPPNHVQQSIERCKLVRLFIRSIKL